MTAHVVAVHRQSDHRFSKTPVDEVLLVQDHGVQGDAHFGTTVQHRSRVARDPSQPNLRQVHLINQGLLTQLAEAGIAVHPGELGENITTAGIELLELSTGTTLQIGEALIEITGLRNPCHQIEDFRSGLLRLVLDKREDGSLVRKAGVMAIVCQSGWVRPGDALRVVASPHPHRPLQPV